MCYCTVVDLDMSLLNQDFNWYQDHNYVTASVKISQKNLKDYRAEFTDTGFTVYANGQCICGTNYNIYVWYIPTSNVCTRHT